MALLTDAGLIDTKALAPEDLALVEQLTTEEAQTLIRIAKKLYPHEPRALKVTREGGRGAQICVPL